MCKHAVCQKRMRGLALVDRSLLDALRRVTSAIQDAGCTLVHTRTVHIPTLSVTHQQLKPHQGLKNCPSAWDLAKELRRAPKSRFFNAG